MNEKLSETTQSPDGVLSLTRTDLLVLFYADRGPVTQKEVVAATGFCDRHIRNSAKKLIRLELIESKLTNRDVIYTGNLVGTPRDSDQQNLVGTPRDSDQPHVLLHTTTDKNTDTQLTLIENDNAQNLGQMDIQTQEALGVFDINPNIIQPFKGAPKLVRKYSPARVLMFYDPDGAIAQNLDAWASAYRADNLDLTYRGKEMSPALIWAKIVELQPPPLKKKNLSFANYAPKEQNNITPEEITWGNVLDILQGQMTRATFSALTGSTLVSAAGDEWVVHAGSSYNRDKLEGHLTASIGRAMTQVADRTVNPTFTF